MKKRKNKNNLMINVISLIFGIISLVLIFIVTGALIQTDNSKATVPLMGLVFGSPTITSTIGKINTSISYTGGMSLTGIISFVLLIIGILFLAISIYKKSKLISFIGNGCLIASGIVMFFVLNTGLDFTTEIGSFEIKTNFVDFYKNYSIAFGTIIYSILNIVGGGVGLLFPFLKK